MTSVFVGRASELEAIKQRFDEGARLVTLHGPGGIGKTELARAYAMGGIVVDLQGAATAAQICDRVAIACGAATGDPTEADVVRIGRVLGELGERLVVLDDFDAAITQAKATVGAWLEAAPQVAFLITSRERLALAGEVLIDIGPLDRAFDLLVDAGRRASSAWSPRLEEGAALTEIATLLEGMPLALELAGARLPLLGAHGLLAMLRQGMNLARDKSGPERHASIDAAIEGSFAALAPPEREALAALATFRGGFDARSAAALGVDPAQLDALRAKSLVRGAARFDLYSRIRAFVEKALPDAVRAKAEAHAAFFVAEAERAAAAAHVDPTARAWLVAERENVLAVVSRVLGAGPVGAREAEPALRAIVALSEVLLSRGPLAAIADVLSPVVERTRDSGADPRLSAKVLLLRGALKRERGDVRGSLKDLLAAESIGRATKDDIFVADATMELGKTVLAGGEIEPARQHFERAGKAFAMSGLRPREAQALALLGAMTGTLGDLARARPILERAVAIAGDDPLTGLPARLLLLRCLAEAGDTMRAIALGQEIEKRALAEHDGRRAGEGLVLLGLAQHDASLLDPAQASFEQARDRFALHGLEADAAIARGHLGVLARERGRAADAYVLIADARVVCERTARPEHAAYFAAHVAELDAAVLGTPAASEVSSPPREIASTWPVWKDGTTLHARLLARTSQKAASPAPPDDALLVGQGGAWFRPPRGERVGLERRRSLALLLERLVAQPGATLTSSALFAAAWPGEKAMASAAAHRVRVAIATLRKMGLRDLITTTPDGYTLVRGIKVVRV